DGAVLTSLMPTMQWSTAQGAAWYRVYIGKGTKETELEQVLSVIVMPRGGDTQQYAISPGILESGNTYFWRVLAGAGEDIESPAFSHFTTP
ncbi:hypothetical protein LLF88_06630, partial [bacterium]|nr:hypothetical protein [bacterium]